MSAGKGYVTAAGDHGALAMSVAEFGHEPERKKQECAAICERLIAQYGPQQQPDWIENLLDALDAELRGGELTELFESHSNGFSMTLIERAAGGVRVGNLGVHRVGCRWNDGTAGRVMRSHSLMDRAEAPEQPALWDTAYRLYAAEATPDSVRWKTQSLFRRETLICAAPFSLYNQILSQKNKSMSAVELLGNNDGLVLTAVREE
jgi:hypothetical protein